MTVAAQDFNLHIADRGITDVIVIPFGVDAVLDRLRELCPVEESEADATRPA